VKAWALENELPFLKSQFRHPSAPLVFHLFIPRVKNKLFSSKVVCLTTFCYDTSHPCAVCLRVAGFSFPGVVSSSAGGKATRFLHCLAREPHSYLITTFSEPHGLREQFTTRPGRGRPGHPSRLPGSLTAILMCKVANHSCSPPRINTRWQWYCEFSPSLVVRPCFMISLAIGNTAVDGLKIEK